MTDPGVDDPQATNPAGWTASTYQYSTTIPHAVTSIAIESGGTNSYEYDANGNMTCRVEAGVAFIQTYNAENRISTIQKLASGTCASPGNLTAHWAFAYDGDGTRVSTLYTPYVGGAPQTSVLTAYYMGGAYEVTGSAVKKYYSVAGMMVAMNDGSGLQYLLTDHLGSTIAVTNSSGTLTSQQRYMPFGAPRTIPNSPIAGTDFGYTGQRKLDDGMGGIMDYKARFYSPALSRFLQPDSIIPDQTNPQAWNRYSYTLGNPIKYSDPSGHGVDCGIGMDCPFDPPTPTPLVDPPDDDCDRNCETDTDGDGVPNIPDPDYPLITPGRGEQSDCVPGNLVECFYNNGIMPGGDYVITLSEFLQLMKAINYDVARRGATGNYDFRDWYDTPFYDGRRLESNVCVQLVGCFARQELNYIAQGASSAAAMEGKTAMTLLITGWKLDQYGELPSYKTLRAAAIGHDYYVLTNPKNLIVSITPFRNPVPFVKTVVQYCQDLGKYC